MTKEAKIRLVRVDDFMTERLEEDSDKLPLGLNDQVAIWRRLAQVYRESKSTKMMKVLEAPDSR